MFAGFHLCVFGLRSSKKTAAASVLPLGQAQLHAVALLLDHCLQTRASGLRRMQKAAALPSARPREAATARGPAVRGPAALVSLIPARAATPS